MKKVYVQVDSERLENGEVVPLTISWRMVVFGILTEDPQLCFARWEFEGIRYTVFIGSAEKIYIQSWSRMVRDGLTRRCSQ